MWSALAPIQRAAIEVQFDWAPGDSFGRVLPAILYARRVPATLVHEGQFALLIPRRQADGGAEILDRGSLPTLPCCVALGAAAVPMPYIAGTVRTCWAPVFAYGVADAHLREIVGSVVERKTAVGTLSWQDGGGF